MIPLFEQYPLLKEKIPYTQLGTFPTPVRHLKNLGKKMGIDYLYLKDDGLSSTMYGGNKVRKLEFLLGDALHKGAKEVLTFGFAGSNHALATAVYTRKLGLKSISILLAQPNAWYVRRNLLFSHVCGAELHHFRNEIAAYIPTIIILLQKKVRLGKFPYIIGPGGSSPLGAIGYVNAGFELREQVSMGLIPEPDTIFIPLGTMGTALGLSIGLKAAGLKTRVVPVRVTDEKYANKKKFFKLFEKTMALALSLDASFPRVEISADEMDIQHDFFGEQYACFTEQGMAAIDLLERSEGIRLEGTYTGKAMAALIDHLRRNGARNEVILFWNTHNTRNFSDVINEIDYHQLHRRFHRYFEEDVQPLDKHPSE
ncbi:MAG: pyridoxal-phosphate dependent enzyme [Deltaproteobacteria bacterium]|nr:pyridoxal-phosphate dependent enzyme [Deltaproteobacteria bacterium]